MTRADKFKVTRSYVAGVEKGRVLLLMVLRKRAFERGGKFDRKVKKASVVRWAESLMLRSGRAELNAARVFSRINQTISASVGATLASEQRLKEAFLLNSKHRSVSCQSARREKLDRTEARLRNERQLLCCW